MRCPVELAGERRLRRPRPRQAFAGARACAGTCAGAAAAGADGDGPGVASSTGRASSEHSLAARSRRRRFARVCARRSVAMCRLGSKIAVCAPNMSSRIPIAPQPTRAARVRCYTPSPSRTPSPRAARSRPLLIASSRNSSLHSRALHVDFGTFRQRRGRLLLRRGVRLVAVSGDFGRVHVGDPCSVANELRPCCNFLLQRAAVGAVALRAAVFCPREGPATAHSASAAAAAAAAGAALPDFARRPRPRAASGRCACRRASQHRQWLRRRCGGNVGARARPSVPPGSERHSSPKRSAPRQPCPS